MTSKQRIYIVEDDPIIALDIKGILTDNGYTIAGHSDTGEEAILEIPKSNADLILMDVNLKGVMDGIEAATYLYKNFKCPLVFLTALSDEETLSRAKLAQPFGYIVKPFEEADIVSSIEISLARKDSSETEVKEKNLLEDSLPKFTDLDQNANLSVEQILSIPIFSNLNEQQISEIAKSSIVRSFSPGDIITSQDNKDFGFIVLSGRVGVVSTSITGKDLIAALLGPGDSYGLFFLLEEFSDKLYAKAQAESKALIIPSNVLNSLLKKSLEFNQSMISELTSQLSKNISIAQALAFSKVEGRIINALLALLPSFGRKVAGGENGGRLFITRKELADFTGTTPETAIRVTKSLERRGLLDLTKPGIIKIPDIDSLRSEAYE